MHQSGTMSPYTPGHKNRLPVGAKPGMYQEDLSVKKDSTTGLKHDIVENEGDAFKELKEKLIAEREAYMRARLAAFEGKLSHSQRDRLIFGSDKDRQRATEEELASMRPQRYSAFDTSKARHLQQVPVGLAHLANMRRY